jgi:anti-sigma factor NepR-like protein
MYLAIKRCPMEPPRIPMSPVDADIRDFLAGRTDGEDLLHQLYDHVLDEPIPERLRGLLRR